MRGDDALAGGNAKTAVQAEAGREGRGLHGEGVPSNTGAGQPAGEGISQPRSSLEGIRQSSEQSWGKAGELYQKKIAENRNYGRNIVDRLSNGAPKALNDVEHSGASSTRRKRGLEWPFPRLYAPLSRRSLRKGKTHSGDD